MSTRHWSLEGQGRVVDGIGSRAVIGRTLDRAGSSRVLMLANRSVTRSGLVVDLAAQLALPPAAMVTTMSANAPVADIEHATSIGADANVDAVVAIGGSSVTDAAKIVRLRLLGDDPDASRIPLVLVPTTLSSGELTPAAGTTGEIAGEKTYVVDARMAPTLVVLDPEVTVATPPDLWLSSGMKAIDHACEALWAAAAHPFSDALASDGLARLWRALPACAADPEDLEARLDAQIGGWFSMSGMTRHGPGPSHLLGHQLAARWGIAHGVTSCITLPHVARLVADERRPGIDRVLATLGFADVDALVAALTDRVIAFGLPHRLRDVGAVEAEIPSVADAAHRHGRSTGYDPADGAATFVAVLRAAW
jgi:alcohol dehydrogenase class IV